MSITNVLSNETKIRKIMIYSCYASSIEITIQELLQKIHKKKLEELDK